MVGTSGPIASAQDTDRALFREHFVALESGALGEAWDNSELTHYVLYPEITIEGLQRVNQLPPANQRKTLKSAYRHHISFRRLTRHWIDLAYQQADWATVKSLHQPGLGSASDCALHLAQAKTGRLNRPALHTTYVRGSTQPACQDFIAWGREQGALEDWSKAERKKVLIQQKRFADAIELATQLGRTNLVVARSALLAHEDPEGYLRKYPGGRYRDEVIRRLIAQDPLNSAQWLRKDEHKHWEWRGVHLILDDHPETPDALAKVHRPLQTRSLREWEIRYFLRHQKWDQVAQRIQALPASLRQEPAWQFWLGEAYSQRGQTSKAERIWKPLARQLSYYGYLAADRLGVDYNLPAPIHTDLTSTQAIERHPKLRIAIELYLAGFENRARSQWRFAWQSMDLAQRQSATELAYRLGWASEELRSAVNSRQTDNFHMFPDSLRATIETGIADQSTDADWLLGLIRTESLFQTDIRSRAGALGLMQVMPQTGEKQFARLGLNWNGAASLLDPKLNMLAGKDYLDRLNQRFELNPVLATAAYNAGPNAVERWLSDTPMDATLWIETIPFKETRGYVKKVLFAATVYNQGLGARNLRLSDRMRPIAKQKN